MTGPIDVFMVAGQSNAQGRAPDRTLSPATTAGLAYERTTAGTLVQLADPVGNADQGSAWPAFANSLTTYSGGVPMCISAAAVGGTWLLPEYGTTANTHWGPGSTLFSTSVSKGLATMTQLTSAGWTPTFRGVLWSQGEYDGMSGNADTALQTKYHDALLDLLARYKTAMSMPALKMYIFRTGPSSTNLAGYAAVRAAQDAACAELADMDMVFTKAVDYITLGYMSDAFHYTQQGYNLMGTEGGLGVAQALGYYTPPPPPAPVVGRNSVLATRLLLGA